MLQNNVSLSAHSTYYSLVPSTHSILWFLYICCDKASSAIQIKVKMQYVQISNIKDTSIIHTISGQSTPMVKSCMDVHLIWLILPLVIEKHLSSVKVLHKSSNAKESSSHVTWNAHTVFLLCGRVVYMAISESSLTK